MTESDTPHQGLAIDRSDTRKFEPTLLAAVDYRGDVTLLLEDGSSIEGFVYDLTGDLATGSVGYMTKQDASRRRLDISAIQKIEFSGRDMAEGKSFHTWIEKYVQKKIAGERASIECEPLED